jgi:hypothetical protein
VSHGPSDHATQPVSHDIGIPNFALFFVLVTICLSIMQGTFVVLASPWGRVWPSENSAKVPLPPANLTQTTQNH